MAVRSVASDDKLSPPCGPPCWEQTNTTAAGPSGYDVLAEVAKPAVGNASSFSVTDPESTGFVSPAYSIMLKRTVVPMTAPVKAMSIDDSPAAFFQKMLTMS